MGYNYAISQLCNDDGVSSVQHRQNNHTNRFNVDTFEVVTFDSLTSTQDLARAAITTQRDGNIMPKGMPTLTGNTVIRAAEQRGGRGRRARDWHSAVGGSYQTLLFAPPLTNQPAVSLWVAIGIARALSQSLHEQSLHKQGVHIMIKWPNDLYVGSKKVAGMLCEWCRGWLLVGVGVNVTNPVPNTATQLNLSLEHVHTHVIAGAAAGVRDWQQTDATLGETFAAWDFLAGRWVTVQTSQKTLTGVALGVDGQGCLQLDTPGLCCDGHVLHWSDNQADDDTSA